MFHAQQQQHGRHGAKVTPAPCASEIEAFRARQRMLFRHGQQQQQQHYHSHGQQSFEVAGNQADALWNATARGSSDNDDSDRVRKLSVAKRRQQQIGNQQQQQSQQYPLPKMPNFGGRQFDAYSDACPDMPSPVPFETHALFNAFDYANAPEAFDEPPNNNSMLQHGHDQQQEQQHGSLWRRRFADDDAHLRRSPKLGRVALWDSASGDNQSSHLSHQQYGYAHHYAHHAPPHQQPQPHPFY